MAENTVYCLLTRVNHGLTRFDNTVSNLFDHLMMQGVYSSSLLHDLRMLRCFLMFYIITYSYSLNY